MTETAVVAFPLHSRAVRAVSALGVSELRGNGRVTSLGAQFKLTNEDVRKPSAILNVGRERQSETGRLPAWAGTVY